MKKAEIVSSKEDYAEMYQGQRCFIVGNGPSLNNTDLNKLSDEYTFGCNKISLLYEKRGWNPSFYVMVSSEIHREDWLVETIKNVDLGIPCFLNEKNRMLSEKTKKFYSDTDSLPHVYKIDAIGGRKGYPYPDHFWSDNPMKSATKHGTILLTCMQIAVYMGFSEIYLIGCDLGFNGPNCNFDPNYNPGQYDPNGDVHSHEAHVLAKRMTEKAGVRVYNATVGGNLEVYPRKRFEELF